MYPNTEIPVDVLSFDDVAFWVPKPSEIDNEGFGYFRDVWPLVDVPSAEVPALLTWERQASEYVSSISTDEREFDLLAMGLESYSPDFEDGDEFPVDLLAVWADLGGLELGVSGLSHALSNAGFFPAASCRTHPDRNWTDAPVVIFASDRERLEKLQPLVADANCGLGYDDSRGHPLFSLYAETIQELMDLAGRLYEQRSTFRSLPKTSRKRLKTYTAPHEIDPLPLSQAGCEPLGSFLNA